MTIEQIKEIIASILQKKIDITVEKDVDFSKHFVEIGLNSLLFVKLLVNIEAELDVEFDEEFINVNYVTDLNDLSSHIQRMLEEKR